MKKILLAIVCIASLASCSKDEVSEIDNNESDKKVSISLSDGSQSMTKSFMSSDATAEIWEKQLSSLVVYVFNSTGEYLIKKTYTSSELSSKSSVFVLPGIKAGDTCEFYAVANIDLPTVLSKQELLDKIETQASNYNGTFSSVNTRAIRSGGFVMSGSMSKIIASSGVTSVNILIKRTVSKVALETIIADAFNQEYPGLLKINSVTILKAASQTSIIETPSNNQGVLDYTHTQVPNLSSNKYQNLFYIFSNASTTVGKGVILEINATYDADGDISTTSDVSTMVYKIELTGSASRQIKRNGYYRVTATINGLLGVDPSVTISVDNWETPVTQSITFG